MSAVKKNRPTPGLRTSLIAQPNHLTATTAVAEDQIGDDQPGARSIDRHNDRTAVHQLEQPRNQAHKTLASQSLNNYLERRP